MSNKSWAVLGLAFAMLVATATKCEARTVQFDAITFAEVPGEWYVPLDDADRALGLKIRRDKAGRCVEIGDLVVADGTLRQMTDGTELLGTRTLAQAGLSVMPGEGEAQVIVQKGRRKMALFAGTKRVEVSLGKQRLYAWQGSRLVLECRISSGRRGNTPAGSFTAGPYKARMHYSTLYQNAPMPWSVQIYRHVFIHGFSSVPDYPASHGCIRMPLDEGNPAKFFYEWVDVGTPVKVTRE